MDAPVNIQQVLDELTKYYKTLASSFSIAFSDLKPGLFFKTHNPVNRILLHPAGHDHLVFNPTKTKRELLFIGWCDGFTTRYSLPIQNFLIGTDRPKYPEYGLGIFVTKTKKKKVFQALMEKNIVEVVKNSHLFLIPCSYYSRPMEIHHTDWQFTYDPN